MAKNYQRCQVLLSYWQEDYLKAIAKEKMISFSDAVRQCVSGMINSRKSFYHCSQFISAVHFKARKKIHRLFPNARSLRKEERWTEK